MHAPTPLQPSTTAAGVEPPTLNGEAQHAAPVSSHAHSGVGQQRLDHSGLELLVRVGRVVQDISAGREVTDAELLAHERDCRRLSEDCYDRFEDHGNPADREEAVLWLARAGEARKCLSAAYKAAREAQIQRGIGEGCFFAEQGDAARAKLERGPASA